MNNRNIKLATKLKVYKAVVLTSLLYGCETWTLYRKQIKQLEGFHMRSLRRIIDIRWQDKVTNLQVLDRANNAVSIEALLLKSTTPLYRPCHQDGCLPHATTNPLWRTREVFKEKRSAKEVVQGLHKGDLETVQLTPLRPGDKCSG